MEKPQVTFTQLFIDNDFVRSTSEKTFVTTDPSTEEEICKVEEADVSDVDKAVKAAKKAFALNSPWRTMDASARGRLLYQLADAMERDIDYIARLETLDCGKPVTDSFSDITFANKVLRYYAGYADKIHGKVVPTDDKSITLTRHEPVGVVAIIVPWNYPLMLAVLALAPALCTGCTVVIKPAEQTPLTTLYLGHLIKETKFPAGVVNIIPGFGETTGADLVSHPGVNSISFTGSSSVGRLIMRAAAEDIKRVHLELGGKSPLIIFADADFEKAAEVAHSSVMINAGQCCVAATRTFVEAPIYEKMVQRLRELAEQRRVGDPFEPSTLQGPQVSERQFKTVMDYIRSGEAEGARLVAGGSRVGSKGYFIAPTVFADVRDDMKIAQEEIFGPVQCILSFQSLEEVIERANNTKYGLGAAVFTKDMDKAMRLSQALQAGSIWINKYGSESPSVPFGGFKMSGFGRVLGKYAIDSFTEVKTISMPISEKNS